MSLRFFTAVLAMALPLLLHADSKLAGKIMAETGVKGGFVVHLGCGDGELTAALHVNDSYMVHGLDTSQANVDAARRHIQSRHLYGPVSADTYNGSRLPYIDNFVKLLVAEDRSKVSDAEIMRALCPDGVAYIKTGGAWKKVVKPRPDNIDEWTHYLYDPSNNAVANDEVAGPPKHLQWVGGPRYSRHHDKMSSVSALVSSGGRIFYIFDEAPRVSILLAPEWFLVARDAFSGTILWKKPIEKWHSHMHRLKSGPAQLPRRLVAVGDRVYCALNYDGPVLAIDAATGETILEYENTAGADEIIYDKGTLYLVVKGDDNVDTDAAKRRGKAVPENKWAATIMAIDAKSGETQWMQKRASLPNTLTLGANQVIFHDGEAVVCLHRRSGEEMWRSENSAYNKKMQSYYAPTMVVHEDVVLFSGGETAGNLGGGWHRGGEDTMSAVDLATGKKLWVADHPPSGYRSAEDLMVINGLVWTGETLSGRAEGVFTGRDPRTGEVKETFEPNVDTYWFHHRCYRGKATKNYMMMSRTGIEYIDMESKDWSINHFVRGACLYGIMPANGLTYAPQHPCACYLEAKLYGFNALAPARKTPARPVARADRLIEGPAYNEPAGAAAGAEDWPTYRQNAARNGNATTQLPTELKQTWKADIGGRLSAPTVAAGNVYVASIDTHTVHAINEKTGRTSWQFKAGGRVDSPPTYDKGRVYFGSADGYVYAVQADTGRLAWRFLAAPRDERTLSFEQLESVWPVHGSTLIINGVLYAVAGRSMFIDGGLRMWRLEPHSGRVLSEQVLDTKAMDNGKEHNGYIEWLNMPTAMPDVLSSDGKFVYMRSQPFGLDGKRLPLEKHPFSGNLDAGAVPAVQGTRHAHIFCPSGFLDDSWWHRTYWMYGTMFLSGWCGYFQAGKKAPAGRLLVHDDNTVYGFGRKPEYWKWTVPIEHHMFAAPKVAATETVDRKGTATGGTRVRLEKSKSFNIAKTPLTIGAWVKSEDGNGVIVARGGSGIGYALYTNKGRPGFAVRTGGKVHVASARKKISNNWTHVAGILGPNGTMQLLIDGKVAAQAKGALISGDPQEPGEIGDDFDSTVHSYGRTGFSGVIDEVRIWHRALSIDELQAETVADSKAMNTDKLVYAASFDDGTATDLSASKNKATVDGAQVEDGKMGKALRFKGGKVAKAVPGFDVAYQWTADMPLYARALALSGDNIFLAGPEDYVNENLVQRNLNDPDVQKRLGQLLDAWRGKSGAVLMAMSKSGEKRSELRIDTPPVFDGFAAANGKLYMSGADGSVQCLGGQ
jgi:outer membrane protein assembly factor BamB